MTLLSWDIPLISFNGSLWDVLLRCSKFARAWLDSFTMILRCWLVVWVKWAPLCLYDTVIQSYVQLKSVSMWTALSWAVLHHWKSMGHFGRSCPQGCNFYPFWGMVLQSLPASSSVVIHKFLRNSRSELRPSKVCPSIVMGLFGRLFAPGANIVPPIAYKSHSTRFPIRPHVLTPHSWLCDKNCGRSSAPK